MNELLAIVNHWDGGTPDKQISGLKNWMINSGSGLFYHRFVKGTEVDYGGSTNKKLRHCGAPVYTPEAVKYFGKYCPDWDHKVRVHNNSPNNCTIGICILHDYADGGFSEETLRTAAKLNADLLKAYNLGIEAVWTHSMICGEDYKHCPKVFVENPDQWEAFKNMIKEYL